MGKPSNPFEYPLVIKQHLNFIVFSIPDLGISIVEDLPPNGKIDVKYMQKMSRTMAKAWLKAAERVRAMKQSKMKTPSPSTTRQALSHREEKGLSTIEVANLLGVSENTIRRMVKRGHIKCETTDGGHRRFLESEVRRYLDSEAPLI